MSDKSNANADLRNREIEQDTQGDTELESVVPPTSRFGGYDDLDARRTCRAGRGDNPPRSCAGAIREGHPFPGRPLFSRLL